VELGIGIVGTRPGMVSFQRAVLVSTKFHNPALNGAVLVPV
jgi:hypothetical protein